MTSNTTFNDVATPYAKAAFEYASQEAQLAQWSFALTVLAEVATTPAFYALLKNPKVSSVALGNLIVENSDDFFSPAIKNFIALLAKNRRLMVLPQIATLFEKYRAMRKKTLQVSVASAFPFSEEQKKQLAVALKIRLQHEVELQFKQDADLIGGVIIKIDDLNLVIDRSVKNALARLANDLICA